MMSSRAWPPASLRPFYHYCEAPHSEEGSPTSVACSPGNASVEEVVGIISSPTDDQPPPRQEGEAVAKPRLRQIRDGAGVGRRAREQLHI